MKNNSNILLIKPGTVGDLLRLTPAVRALAVKYPEAWITLQLGSAAAATEVFETMVDMLKSGGER